MPSSCLLWNYIRFVREVSGGSEVETAVAPGRVFPDVEVLAQPEKRQERLIITTIEIDKENAEEDGTAKRQRPG
jgi:hypothetical protein